MKRLLVFLSIVTGMIVGGAVPLRADVFDFHVPSRTDAISIKYDWGRSDARQENRLNRLADAIGRSQSGRIDGFQFGPLQIGQPRWIYVDESVLYIRCYRHGRIIGAYTRPPSRWERHPYER